MYRTRLRLHCRPSRQVERVINPFDVVGAALTACRTIKETVRDQLKVEGAVAIQKDQIVRVGDSVRSIAETASIARYAPA